MSERLHIVTPATRLENLPKIAGAIKESFSGWDVHWWIVIDQAPAPFPASLRRLISSWNDRLTVWFHHAPTPGAWGHPQRSAALTFIPDGWVWGCDDDNIPHPAMGARLLAIIADHPTAGGIVVAQERADGRVLHPSPAELRPEGVDTAQYVIRRDVIGDERVQPVPADDGGFVMRIWNKHLDRFIFVDEILAWHNRLI